MLKTSRAHYIATVLMAICFVLGTFMTAFAAEFPPKPTNNIYVVDQAGVLKEEAKQQILAIGRDVKEKAKGAQVIVVTVNTLNGMDIESYANELFRTWGIGDAKSNNGILFLVAVKDRKMRVEIGGGMEGRIPDMTAGRIMDEYAKPYFAKNDFNGGILNTYKALTNEVYKEYNIEGATQSELKKAPPGKKYSDVSLLAAFLALVFWQQLLVIIVILIILWLCINLGIFPFFGGGGGGGFSDGFGGGGSGGGGSSDDF